MPRRQRPEDLARAVLAPLLKESNPVGRPHSPRALRDAYLAQGGDIKAFAAGMMWLFDQGYLAKHGGEDITLTQAGLDALKR